MESPRIYRETSGPTSQRLIALYQVKPIRRHILIKGLHPPTPFGCPLMYKYTLQRREVGFCLVSFHQEHDTDSSIVESHSRVESNSFCDLVSSSCTWLCYLISQARVIKPSWRGQSSYSLVDNQRVCGAKIAGFISLDSNLNRCVSSLPKLIFI
jgi:hypothetical protein